MKKESSSRHAKTSSCFDEAPEMSIEEITRATLAKIKDPSCNFTVVNFPNVDVVGHIENEPAVIRAIQAVDQHAGILIDEALKENLTVIVTADHGTVEKWLYPDGGVDTGHTDSPVPFILLHPNATLTLKPQGELTDIAPTILDIIGLPIPTSMTGASLIEQNRNSFAPVQRLLLMILDGWGLCENTKGNLIACAETPVMDKLMKSYPSSQPCRIRCGRGTATANRGQFGSGTSAHGRGSTDLFRPPQH